MQNRPNWEPERRNSRPDRNRQSKRLVFRRSLFLMLVCGVGLFIPLVIQLWNISIRDHDFYQQRAAQQQLMDVSVSAHRGEIRDANGEVLAMSATVYELILAPKDLMNSVDQDDFEDEDGNLDEAAWQAAVDDLREESVDGLVAIRPDLDRADLERRMAEYESRDPFTDARRAAARARKARHDAVMGSAQSRQIAQIARRATTLSREMGAMRRKLESEGKI